MQTNPRISIEVAFDNAVTEERAKDGAYKHIPMYKNNATICITDPIFFKVGD